jgi:hypothetical protein
MRLTTLLIALFTTQIAWAQFTVEGAGTPELDPIQLIEEVCLGPGIEVLEINYNGDPEAVGHFSGGDDFFGLEEGFVMTTGIASNATTGRDGVDMPSVNTASEPNNSQVGFYADLVELANSFDMHDVAEYTIRFIPTGDTVAFRYIFASEEYPQYVCTDFNDVFAFFLEGPVPGGSVETQNLAVIPGTDLPVSINSVNNGEQGSFPTSDLIYCDESANGSLDYAQFFNFNPPFNFPVHNGFTDVFMAKSAVIPCQEYTMRLVIADFGDALWDSAIFFEAESFCSFGDHNETETLPLIVEACAPPFIELDLTAFPPSEYPLTYTVSGTAQVGADYFGLPPQGEITTPTAIWSLILPVLDDGIDEDTETIIIDVTGASCSNKTFTLQIIDRFAIEGPSNVICSPEPTTLSLVGDPDLLDDFDILWSTGDTTTSIDITPVNNTFYTVLYTNGLSTCDGFFPVSIENPEEELNLTLCTNEEGVTVNGTVYDFYNLSGVEILEGASVAGCDSIVHINITPQVFEVFSPELCAGESIEINGTLYNSNNPGGLEVLSGAAANGCDSVLRINITPIEESFSNFREELCEDDQIMINGTVYDKANPTGTEVIVGGAANGCDSIVEIALEILFNTESEIDVAIDEGMDYIFDGQVLTASGSYQFVYPAANNCDSTVTINLMVNPITSALTDSIAVGQEEEACINTSIFQQVESFENVCSSASSGTLFELDANNTCVKYSGVEIGIDTACIVACDALGICDTTYLVISVFDNLLAAVDDYDTTLYDQAITIEVLANDWISETVIDTQYIVAAPAYGTASVEMDGTINYAPSLTTCLQTDVFSYAICNDIGCDTAQVFLFLDENTGLCDPVWPGDVNNDGIVNQIDHWAVGLAYGQNGPVRPNASFDWIGQPAIDWNGTITFIYEFNLKYADCNGTGQINTDDVGPIYVNWGLTHPISPFGYQFPEKNIERQSEVSASGDWVEHDLFLGQQESPLIDAYGFGFEVQFGARNFTEISFDVSESIIGEVDEDLLVLQKIDLLAGKGYISVVRNDQTPITDYGMIGRLRTLCPGGNCGDITINNFQLLRGDGQIFNITDEWVLSASPLSSVQDIRQESLQLFPNPVSDRLTVISSNQAIYHLYTAAGQQVRAGQLVKGHNTLPTHTLSPGLYYLRALINNEQLVYRFVVE